MQLSIPPSMSGKSPGEEILKMSVLMNSKVWKSHGVRVSAFECHSVGNYWLIEFLITVPHPPSIAIVPCLRVPDWYISIGTELKVIGMVIHNKIPFVKELEKEASHLRRPAANGSKAQFLSYICHVLLYLRANPEHWTIIEDFVASRTRNEHAAATATATPTATATNNYPQVANVHPYAVGATAFGAAASSSSSLLPNAAHDVSVNSQYSHPYSHTIHSASTSASCSTSSTTSLTPSPVNIETIRGIECINLLQHPTGNLPHNLIAEYQRRSHYKGHPSKLRYEQVIIKQEKNAESSSNNNTSYTTTAASTTSSPQRQPPPPPDAPRNPTEFSIINSLQQMGFSDMQEMMGGLRHVQEQQMGQMNNMNMIDINGMVEQIMMFIVTQREEKDEAKKMDEARRLSEVTILQEEEQRRVRTREEEERNQRRWRAREGKNSGGTNSDDGDDDIVMISYDDILCTTGASACFPDSDILRCKKTVKVFRALLKEKDGVQNTIRKLLTLESKSRKWYGKIIPVPYFRHTLTDKIIRASGTAVQTSGSIPFGDRSNVVRILDNEISNLEKGMYTLSEQMEYSKGLQYPKLFHLAKEAANAKGLLVDQERDVIMLDDD